MGTNKSERQIQGALYFACELNAKNYIITLILILLYILGL